MRFVKDDEVAEWLSRSPPFQWDDGNRSKSLEKHGLSCEDIESIVQAPMAFAGRIVDPEHDEARFLLLGKLRKGN